MSNQNQQTFMTDTNLSPRNWHASKSSSFPRIGAPSRVAYFSVNGGRGFEWNCSNLRFYKEPHTFPLDLNAGLENAIKRLECANDEGITHLLKMIHRKRDQLIKRHSIEKWPGFILKLDVDVVTWRGILTLIMNTPYDRTDWCLHVTHFNGTYYISRKDTEYERLQRQNQTSVQRRMCSWGYKFEQYCLSASADSQPDTSSPVNENEEFVCVYTTKVDSFNLMYGAEMDGVFSLRNINLDENPQLLSTVQFVELKVCDLESNFKSFVDHKSRKWWCQSFLVNVDDIIVGQRDRFGRVNNVKHMDVKSLTKFSKESFWNPNICANFLVEFLNKIHAIVRRKDCPHTVYEFYYNHENGRITYQCFEDVSQHSFLPEWYIKLFHLK